MEALGALPCTVDINIAVRVDSRPPPCQKLVHNERKQFPFGLFSYFEVQFIFVILGKAAEEYRGRLRQSPAESLPVPFQICRAFEAHLSRNALKIRASHEERFVTQRVKGLGLNKAVMSFKALEKFLCEQGIPVSKSIYEFNIFDSNISLDAGWIVK